MAFGPAFPEKFLVPTCFFPASRYNNHNRRGGPGGPRSGRINLAAGKEDSAMSEEYGPDFVSVTDDEGNEFELEHLGTLEYNGQEYMAFVPADMDEDDEDFGLILLKVIEQDGEQLLADIDDEQELNAVYEQFMQELFEDEEEE